MSVRRRIQALMKLAEEERLKRKAEEGYTSSPMYHATRNQVEGDHLDPKRSETTEAVFLTSKPEFANRWINSSLNEKKPIYREDSQVVPLILRDDAKVWDYRDPADRMRMRDELPDEIKDAQGYNTYSGKELIRALREGDWGLLETPEIMKYLREKGYDAFWLNEFGVDNMGVLNVEKLRSPNADFNPLKRHEKDMMANLMGIENVYS